MSTSTPPAEGQTPSVGPVSGQTPPTPQQTPATPPPSSEDEQPMSVTKARELREELKARRLSEEKALATLKKLQDAQLTEEQRKEQRMSELEKQALALQQERQTWLLDRAVLIAAPKVGIDPELAQRLIDLSQVKTDSETGEPEPDSVQEALKALLKRYPNLAIVPSQEPSSQRPPAPRVPSTTPPASSVGTPVQETVKDLKKYNLTDAYKRTRPQ